MLDIIARRVGRRLSGALRRQGSCNVGPHPHAPLSRLGEGDDCSDICVRSRSQRTQMPEIHLLPQQGSGQGVGSQYDNRASGRQSISSSTAAGAPGRLGTTWHSIGPCGAGSAQSRWRCRWPLTTCVTFGWPRTIWPSVKLPR